MCECMFLLFDFYFSFYLFFIQLFWGGWGRGFLVLLQIYTMLDSTVVPIYMNNRNKNKNAGC